MNSTRNSEKFPRFFKRVNRAAFPPVFLRSPAISTPLDLAISASQSGVGRRASIIHSADNQKSWKHTFMRRVVAEGEGWARRTLSRLRVNGGMAGHAERRRMGEKE